MNQQDLFKQQRAQFAKEKQERKLKIAAMKEELEERELRARYAKANFDLMHYSLEAEKLQPGYKEFVDRERQRAEDAEKQRQEFLKALSDAQANSEEKTSSDLVEVNNFIPEAGGDTIKTEESKLQTEVVEVG